MIKHLKLIVLTIAVVFLITSVIGYAGDNKAVKQDKPTTSQVQTQKACQDKHANGECTKSESAKCNNEKGSAECKEKCSKECKEKCSKEGMENCSKKDMEKCSKECKDKCLEQSNPKK
jgi:hypothetical protein